MAGFWSVFLEDRGGPADGGGKSFEETQDNKRWLAKFFSAFTVSRCRKR